MTRSSFSLSTPVVWFDIVTVDKDDKLPGRAPATSGSLGLCVSDV